MGYGDYDTPCVFPFTNWDGKNHSDCGSAFGPPDWGNPYPVCGRADNNLGSCRCGDENIYYVDGTCQKYNLTGDLDVCSEYIAPWKDNVFIFFYGNQNVYGQYFALIKRFESLIQGDCKKMVRNYLCSQFFPPCVTHPSHPAVVVRQPTCYSSCAVGYGICKDLLSNPLVRAFLPRVAQVFMDCNTTDIIVGHRPVFPTEGWMLGVDGEHFDIPCRQENWLPVSSGCTSDSNCSFFDECSASSCVFSVRKSWWLFAGGAVVVVLIAVLVGCFVVRKSPTHDYSPLVEQNHAEINN